MDRFSIGFIKDTLRRLDRRAMRSLGQHFLINRRVAQLLIESANVVRTDAMLEIGPGLGALTELLADRAGRVMAIEKDRALAGYLRDSLPASNLEVHEADILRFDVMRLIGAESYKVVASLPYNIATAIMGRLLEAQQPPRIMSVLLQLEVAKRLVAPPGDRERGALTVLTEALASVRLIETIRPSAFYPPPRVSSAIVTIIPHAKRPKEYRLLCRLVKAGFSAKRKQLINSLAGGLRLERPIVESSLKAAGIDPQLRAENLRLVQWERLLGMLEK